MPTPDEVIAALRDALIGLRYRGGIEGGPTRYCDHAADPCRRCEAAQTALDLARQYRGWRSLEEEKPADGQEVLIATPEWVGERRIGMDYYNAEYDCFRHNQHCRLWHPLPQPPKP